MENKVKYFEVESGESAASLINELSYEKDIFATQLLPITQGGNTVGVGLFVWYKKSGELITDYDKAKSKKVENKINLPASDKQIKYLLGLGYKGETKNLTVLQAKSLIEGFVGRGNK